MLSASYEAGTIMENIWQRILRLSQRTERFISFGYLNQLAKYVSVYSIAFQTLCKENSLCTPLPFGNLPLSDSPTLRNFRDPPWGGYGYFLEPHNIWLGVKKYRTKIFKSLFGVLKKPLFINHAMFYGIERERKGQRVFRQGVYMYWWQTRQLRSRKFSECTLSSTFVSPIFQIPRVDLFLKRAVKFFSRSQSETTGSELGQKTTIYGGKWSSPSSLFFIAFDVRGTIRVASFWILCDFRVWAPSWTGWPLASIWIPLAKVAGWLALVWMSTHFTNPWLLLVRILFFTLKIP